ncbi:unnamed protein product, partial [Owenia fusiformis]
IPVRIEFVNQMNDSIQQPRNLKQDSNLTSRRRDRNMVKQTQENPHKPRKRLQQLGSDYEANIDAYHDTLAELLSKAKEDDFDRKIMEESISNFGDVRTLMSTIERSLADTKPISLAVIGGSISRGPDSYSEKGKYKRFVRSGFIQGNKK